MKGRFRPKGLILRLPCLGCTYTSVGTCVFLPLRKICEFSRGQLHLNNLETLNQIHQPQFEIYFGTDKIRRSGGSHRDERGNQFTNLSIQNLIVIIIITGIGLDFRPLPNPSSPEIVHFDRN